MRDRKYGSVRRRTGREETMNIRMLRQIVLPAVLCAQIALVPVPAAGQSGAGVDEPQRVAEGLAGKLVTIMFRDKLHGQRVALQPLGPDTFRGLQPWERQKLYDLLAASLQAKFQQNFEWVDPSRFDDVSRMLENRAVFEEQGKPEWYDRYERILRNFQTQLNISCKPGSPPPGKFRLICGVDTLPEVEVEAQTDTHGTAWGDFPNRWLRAPLDPDTATTFVADSIVRYMQVESVLGKVSIVDAQTKSETPLTGHIAGLLEDKINAIRQTAPRVIEGKAGTGSYGVEGTIDDRLVLRVGPTTGGEAPLLTTFRAPMQWTAELREIAGSAEDQPVSGGECEAGADLAKRMVKDEYGEPITLGDWVWLEGDRLVTADYEGYRDVIIKAKRYLADHCGWEGLDEFLGKAISGLAKELEKEIKRDLHLGLERLLRAEAAAGRHRVLLELRARAYKSLGDRRQEDRAYSEWLDLVPQTPEYKDQRIDILNARALARAEIKREDAERALELGGPERSLVRRGLSSFGFDGGEGTAEFDEPFREELRSWQAKNERTKTGYLTKDQSEALMAAGRAAEKRAQDDVAFARAKTADTTAAYAEYLARYPSGRHAAEAKRLLDIARAREDEARAQEEAQATEEALALKDEERVLVERGLSSWKSGGGAVDGRFDASFRALLRSWQASKGRLDTGYLTAEQARELIAEGEAAGEREQDDRAFARAKAADTEEAYLAYLSEFPDGRHAAEARRLLEAVRAREDDAAFARAKRADTAAAYAAYLSQYPDGRHASEARRLREAALVREVAGAEEKALNLTREKRVLVERGLASKVPGGILDGRFDESFRAALRRWQTSRGDTATGYLTRGQAVVLMGLGREVEERKRDDAAFSRAKAADTVASYTRYLTEYPNGRHVVEARRLREAAREREERRKATAPAEVEKALGLTYEQKRLVQYGLVSKGHEIGEVDGVLGRRTRAAIRSHQGREGLAQTGYLTAELSRAMQALGRRHVEKVRAERERRERERLTREKAERERLAREKAERERLAQEKVERERRKRERALLEPGRRFRDCEGSWCPELVVVPAGRYMMGTSALDSGGADERPRHRVTIAKPFAVGVMEVTRGQWRRFVEETGHPTVGVCGTYEGDEWKGRSGRSWRNPGFSQTDEHPVVCVSWEDAKSYVRWLSGKTGEHYRLLSESEWEYVARAGTTTSRYWGPGSGVIQCRHANGADRTLKGRYGDWKRAVAPCRDRHVHTSPVGSYEKNGFGLYDVLGNVWEWVEDCSSPDYRGAPSDGRAWTAGGDCSRRALRGGAWNEVPGVLRSMYRHWVIADGYSSTIGFRVARTLD